MKRAIWINDKMYANQFYKMLATDKVLMNGSSRRDKQFNGLPCTVITREKNMGIGMGTKFHLK